MPEPAPVMTTTLGWECMAEGYLPGWPEANRAGRDSISDRAEVLFTTEDTESTERVGE
jgi:hypothetical protein